MKNRAVLSFMFLAIAGVALPGCLEVETTTKVNRDGSLIRTVLFTGDSSEVFQRDRPYPLTVDSLWPSTIRKVDDKKFEYSATRTFSDASDLDKAIAGIPLKTLDVSVGLEQDFLWFVTDYRYRETYHRWNPFDNVTITDYISQPELDLILRFDKEEKATKADSLAVDTLSAKYEEWDARNIFESIFAALLEGVRMLHDPSLSPETVISRKEELFLASKKPILDNKMDTLRIIFSRILKTRLLQKVLDANKPAVDLILDQLEFRNSISTHTFKLNVEMPGTVTGTNAKSIEGNVVHFTDFKEVAYFSDYEMWVTSRVINWWAVIVTAAVIVLGAVVLVAGRRKK